MENTPKPPDTELWPIGVNQHPAYLAHQQALNSRARARLDAMPIGELPWCAALEPYHEWRRDVMPIAQATRLCDNESCGWTGTSNKMNGNVGPMCPVCGETTDDFSAVLIRHRAVSAIAK